MLIVYIYDFHGRKNRSIKPLLRVDEYELEISETAVFKRIAMDA